MTRKKEKCDIMETEKPAKDDEVRNYLLMARITCPKCGHSSVVRHERMSRIAGRIAGKTPASFYQVKNGGDDYGI